jgi:deoxyhypusine synthase
MASSSANVPSGASAAVLKPSEPMPEFAVSVEGPNFDVPVTLDNLLDSYARIGFQAHSLGRAIDIVNKMVMYQYVYPVYFSHIATAAKLEAFGRTNGRRRVR